MHGYIILGLVAAGIMREFISDNYIKENLGGRGIWSSVKASLFGLPLPLCSCAVIPLAASLRKSGAGRGAVASFYISTPMTGIDSVIATYGVFGWFISVMRVFSASVTAIVAGVFIDKYDDEKLTQVDTSSCCCSGSCDTGEKAEKQSFVKRVRNIFQYAFVELLGDIAYPLLIGLLLAAVITLFITPDMMGEGRSMAVGYLLAFAVGVPLYVCSISAIPIAMSLLVAGFSPGAAFIFLAAAPATNVIAMNVAKDILGKKGMLIYMASILFFTLATALSIDVFFADMFQIFDGDIHDDDSFGIYAQFTSVLFLSLVSYMSFKKKFFKK